MVEKTFKSDHDFAQYLKSKNVCWKWTIKGNCVNRFLDCNAKLIAVVIYNNTKCTYKVFIPK